MAESKSDEYVSKINERSEFSSSVHPLIALGNFLRSECRLSCYRIGPGTIPADQFALQSLETALHEVHRPGVNENAERRKGSTNTSNFGAALGANQITPHISSPHGTSLAGAKSKPNSLSRIT
jgi:hypothetical protein